MERSGTTPRTEKEQQEILLFVAAEDLNAKEELLRRCCESEKSLIGTYREVLNEPFVPGATRRILRQQLNGILYCFVQLKLLGNQNT